MWGKLTLLEIRTGVPFVTFIILIDIMKTIARNEIKWTLTEQHDNLEVNTKEDWELDKIKAHG